MTIWFECICGAVLNAPDKGAGKWGRCPYCQSRMRVPEESTSPAVGNGTEDSDTQIIALPDEEQSPGSPAK